MTHHRTPGIRGGQGRTAQDHIETVECWTFVVCYTAGVIALGLLALLLTS